MGKGVGDGKRTGGHELLPCRIHRKVQSLERARAEKNEVAGFGKDNLIDGEAVADSEDGEPDAASD